MSFWRRRRREDLDRELRDHLDLEAEAQQESGLPPTEAHYAAKRLFGNTTLVKEDTAVMWGWTSLERLEQDLRYAVRMLRKSPAFAITAALTLALGIGANTVIFSAVNAVLLKPLPFRDPARLVQLWETHPVLRQVQVPYPDFIDWRDQTSTFEQMDAYTFQGFQKFNLVSGDEPEQAAGTLVSGNLLPLLGIHPTLGRNFLPEEVQPGHDQVAILGYSVWQRRFGGRADLIGQSIRINGDLFRVVGVMCANARFPEWADVLMPLSRLNDYDRTNRKHHQLVVIGRLKQGVSVQQAQSELQGVAQRLQRIYPATNNTIGAAAIPLQDQVVGEVKTPLLVLLAAVGLILLIACANVANLLLARATVRRREIAIRIALGAGSGRLLGQMLIESLVLSLFGAMLGLALAGIGIPLLRNWAADQLPRAQEIAIDSGVLLFTLAVAVGTGILFGLAPALQAIRPAQNDALRAAGRSSSGDTAWRGFRRILVAAEVGLAMMVLVSAGLLVRSFTSLLAVDPGFRPDHLLSFQVSLPATKYQKFEQVQGFFQQLMPHVANLPGVQGVAAIDTLPFTSALNRSRFGIEGAPPPESGRYPVAQVRSVTPEYFHLMGVALRRGRPFSDADTEATAPPACVINEALARRFYPGKDPVGQKLLLGVVDPKPTAYPIVGVVADTRDLGLAVDADPEIYFPGLNNPMTVVVRTSTDPLSLAAAIRREVRSIDAEQPIAAVRSMDQILAASLASRRFSMVLLSGFSGLALLLAAVGLYGLVSYSVAQRTQEMGLRMALGASRSEVFRLVVGESVLLSVSGLSAGLLCSLLATRFLANLLYGVSATDPLTFAGGSVLLLLIAFTAAVLPAHRASSVDPMSALRCE